MKKEIKGKIISKKEMQEIKGGGPGDYPGWCIRAALEIGIDPIGACCPACNRTL